MALEIIVYRWDAEGSRWEAVSETWGYTIRGDHGSEHATETYPTRYAALGAGVAAAQPYRDEYPWDTPRGRVEPTGIW